MDADRARSCSSIPGSAACRCSADARAAAARRRSSMPPTAPAFPTAPRARPRSPRACRRCSGGWSSAIDPRLVVIACNTASTIALDRGPRRARPAGGRHGARRSSPPPMRRKTPRDRRARHRCDGAPALCRRSCRDASPRDCTVLRHGSAELVELAEAKLRGERDRPGRYAADRSPACSTSRAATGSTRSSSPARISRWSSRRTARGAARACAFVDGGAGIARRIAYLTDGQAWPGRRRPKASRVFTAPRRGDALAPALSPATASREIEHSD